MIGISDRIAGYPVCMSIGELMEEVTLPNAKSFTPAIFKNGERSNETWASQQLFALDIDSGLTIEEAVKLSKEVNVIPVFIYSSFSHTEEHHKFRMIFLLNEEIHDMRVRNLIQYALRTLFPTADRNANDPARLLFGGKKVEFYSDSVISVVEILDAVVKRIKMGPNSTRDIKKFCEQTGLSLCNGYPHYKVINEDELRFLERNTSFISLTKNRTNPINYYRTRAKISHSSYCLHFTGPDKTEEMVEFAETREGQEVKTVRNFPYDNLIGRCRLFKESITGEYWLYHNEVFGIMTNLLNVEGGKSKVLEILNSRPEYSRKKDDWQLMLNQIKKLNYLPSNCDSFCPFADECIHAKNMIQQGKLPRGSVQILENSELQPIDEVYNKLDILLDDILCNKPKGIYVVKAPTGIGKTELLIKHAEKNNYSIAFPTHKLKHEVSQRLGKYNIEHFVVPELPELEGPIGETINHLYNIGAYRSVSKHLRQIAANNEQINEFLDSMYRMKKVKNQVFLTTHQRSIYTKDDSNSTLIFDEDPIPSLYPISKLKMTELVYAFTRLQENGENKDVFVTLQNMILNAPLDIVHERSSFLLPATREMETVVVGDANINSNILGFLNCDYFIKKRLHNSEWIYFIQKNSLPADKKIIILSATINEQVSKLVFGKDVQFFNLGEVKPKGTLLQITSKSFSRYSINESEQDLKQVAQKLIDTYNPNSEIISYKSYFQEENGSSVHFGNTEGIDDLKGKNITVIGTPHLNPLSYLLLSVCLGYRMGLQESRMEYIPVERNGLRFYFNTYNGDSLLREIQFYLVESQLFQAVGRARVNRYPSKVLILSNLPVVGAEYIALNTKELANL
ncbi:hypothetical protein M3576_03160 [Weizmannia ginsengihumi]|nr:hypothetical protein [Heyndrickxia ginsengihumi]